MRGKKSSRKEEWSVDEVRFDQLGQLPFSFQGHAPSLDKPEIQTLPYPWKTASDAPVQRHSSFHGSGASPNTDTAGSCAGHGPDPAAASWRPCRVKCPHALHRANRNMRNCPYTNRKHSRPPSSVWRRKKWPRLKAHTRFTFFFLPHSGTCVCVRVCVLGNISLLFLLEKSQQRKWRQWNSLHNAAVRNEEEVVLCRAIARHHVVNLWIHPDVFASYRRKNCRKVKRILNECGAGMWGRDVGPGCGTGMWSQLVTSHNNHVPVGSFFSLPINILASTAGCLFIRLCTTIMAGSDSSGDAEEQLKLKGIKMNIFGISQENYERWNAVYWFLKSFFWLNFEWWNYIEEFLRRKKLRQKEQKIPLVQTKLKAWAMRPFFNDEPKGTPITWQ